jgi:hypothetical protein
MWRVLSLLALVVAALVACGDEGGSPASGGLAGAQPVPHARALCGTRPHPPRYDHIVVIAFENKSRDVIFGPRGRAYAPYINSLANRCAKHVRFAADARFPSLPQYIEATSGTNAGITANCEPGPGCIARVRSAFGQIAWRTYAESMPGRCARRNHDRYAARHNPAVYYTTLLPAVCAARDVPLRGRPNLGATLTWIIPNLCHDMHDACPAPTRHFPHGCARLRRPQAQYCRIESGDVWLSRWLPANVLNTGAYRSGKTVVFLWWDEGAGRRPDLIPLVAISRSIRPGTVGAPAAVRNHYDFLRTIETMAGKPCLAAACGQTPMLHELGLR